MIASAKWRHSRNWPKIEFAINIALLSTEKIRIYIAACCGRVLTGSVPSLLVSTRFIRSFHRVRRARAVCQRVAWVATILMFALAACQTDDASYKSQQALELSRAGRYVDAIVEARRALNAARHNALAALDNHSSSRETEAIAEIRAAALNNLALLDRARGNITEAGRLLRQALRLQENAFGGSHPNTAVALNNLAELDSYSGDYEASRKGFVGALAMLEETVGGQHWQTASVLANLAAVYRQQERFEDAIKLTARSLQILERTIGSEGNAYAAALMSAAELYFSAGRQSEALRLGERALAIYRRNLGADHLRVIQGLTNLAEASRGAGNSEQAAQYLATPRPIWSSDTAAITCSLCEFCASERSWTAHKIAMRRRKGILCGRWRSQLKDWDKTTLSSPRWPVSLRRSE